VVERMAAAVHAVEREVKEQLTAPHEPAGTTTRRKTA
jgi:hypothetical protein